jgi:hypothetical protein
MKHPPITLPHLTRPMSRSSSSPSPSPLQRSAVAPGVENVKAEDYKGPPLLGTPEQLAVSDQIDVQYEFSTELTHAQKGCTKVECRFR